MSSAAKQVNENVKRTAELNKQEAEVSYILIMWIFFLIRVML